MTCKHTIGTTIAFTVITTIMFLVVAIFYFVFFETPYLKYTNLPLPILGSNIHPGDVIPIHVARCNSDKVAHVYTLSRTLEKVANNGNAREYVLMRDLKIRVEPGCSEADSLVHIAPPETPKGQWILIGTADIQGRLVHHTVEWYSVPFEIK